MGDGKVIRVDRMSSIRECIKDCNRRAISIACSSDLQAAASSQSARIFSSNVIEVRACYRRPFDCWIPYILYGLKDARQTFSRSTAEVRINRESVAKLTHCTSNK